MKKAYPRKEDLKIGEKYWSSWKSCWLWYRGEKYHGQDEQFYYYFEDIYNKITVLAESELPALAIIK